MISYLKQLFLGIRFFLLNRIVLNIPFSKLRNYCLKTFILKDSTSNVLAKVEILGHKRDNIKIGKNSVVNTKCLLDGRVGSLEIGDNVDIARETNIFTLEHDPNSNQHKTRSGDVVIEDYVWIASRVTILPGVRIGKGSVVATNSVVTNDIAPGDIVAGIPAKKIGKRNSKLEYELNYFPFFR
jgi:maltose O-acetyltransferase